MRPPGWGPPSDDVLARLERAGFHRTYQSTAVCILSHPSALGLEVRVGTVLVVAVRDGREIYRAPLAELDIDELRRRAGLD